MAAEFRQFLPIEDQDPGAVPEEGRQREERLSALEKALGGSVTREQLIEMLDAGVFKIGDSPVAAGGAIQQSMVDALVNGLNTKFPNA